MKKILITGVAGFIGSSLCDRLIARGDFVIGIDDFNDYYDPLIKRKNIENASHSPRWRLYETDICNEELIRQIFAAERPEIVVHLAARAGVRPSLKDPQLYNRVNVIGSQIILDACRDFPPSHLVFASSSSVYGGSTRIPFSEEDPVMFPVSPYAATKRMNELQAHVYSHVYGLNITLLRFFTVYGPRQRPDMAIHKFIKLIEEEKPVPIFGDGTSQRDYTYIDDILDGIEKAIDKPFRYEIFNLGESKTTTLLELLGLLEKHLQKKAKIKFHPNQPGDVPITYANIEKAKTMLGYAPKFSMDEGIKKMVKWYREVFRES